MKKIIMSFALLTTVANAAMEPIPVNENPRLLMDGQREITSLIEIEKMGLNQKSTQLDLWSGNYWPHFQGALGVRYRDPKFAALISNKSQFAEFKKLKEKTPMYSYAGKENLLSPAEKYDLLVGDPAMSLTSYAWKLGKDDESGGKVKIWRGICDGWASASQKMPRPVKNVTLKTPSGVAITFFPEDIKALGSLLYARAQGPVIFLGERCEGGMFKSGCKETNPGTFHRALVNRVGNLGKTFIADVSPGGEVWNYPIQSYKLSYYNVFTEEESENFKDSLELFAKKNRFEKSDKRHKSTYAIVGVTAVVSYKDMRPSNLLETDHAKNDTLLTKTYYYDLELDKNMNILGGESESKDLPDFIWAPNDITYPLSDAEVEADGSTGLVKMSQEAAKLGQPLSSVVKKLFEAAK